MAKRKADNLSYEDAISSMLDWVEQGEDSEDFSVQTNNILDNLSQNIL